jgi:hypothetical protein
MSAGFRVSVYWEEFGTVEEGGMNDEQTTTVKRKPTSQEMREIKRAIQKKLKELGLVRS